MLLDLNTLKQVSYELQQNGNKIVFTNGCFDILHSGHVTYLNESKKQGDYLVLGLNSDNSVKKLKGETRPINNQNDRAIVLSGLKSVDFVCIFDEETPKDMIEAISPNVLTKGGDYIIENIVGAEFVINKGGKVVVINFVEGKSTTNIINKAKL